MYCTLASCAFIHFVKVFFCVPSCSSKNRAEKEINQRAYTQTLKEFELPFHQ